MHRINPEELLMEKAKAEAFSTAKNVELLGF